MPRQSVLSTLGGNGRQSVAGYAGLGEEVRSNKRNQVFILGRTTRAGTMVDGSDMFNFRTINNEMNILKTEEEQRRKIQRIRNTGSEYQRIVYEVISSSKFQNTIMCCVFINIILLLLPTMPTTVEFGLYIKR